MVEMDVVAFDFDYTQSFGSCLHGNIVGPNLTASENY